MFTNRLVTVIIYLSVSVFFPTTAPSLSPASSRTAESAAVAATPHTDSSPGDYIEQRLRMEYRRWRGTRHRLGGNDQRGVDCSGFVRAVYRKLFKIQLPRTARDQAQSGIPVKRHRMRPGDLIFFKPPGYPHHVGIFLGADKFVHASKSKGVTISRIGPVYWEKYYWTARRILQLPIGFSAAGR